jgi:phospholipid-transporting ATPase
MQQRLRADIKVNNKKYTVIEPNSGSKQVCLAYKIRVGDLVYVETGDRIPVDMAVLASSSSTGVVFMETSPLDGETNLKPIRCASPATQVRPLFPFL